jgi:hypothetical protein
MPAHPCDICGGPSGLTLTEITPPRGAVVTRHYCAAHRPPEDPHVDRAIIHALSSRRDHLRQAIARADELLERFRREYPKRPPADDARSDDPG